MDITAIIIALLTSLFNLIIYFNNKFSNNKKKEIAKNDYISTETEIHIREVRDNYIGSVMDFSDSKILEFCNKSTDRINQLIENSEFKGNVVTKKLLESEYKMKLLSGFGELKKPLRHRCIKNGFLGEDNIIFNTEIKNNKAPSDYKIVWNKLQMDPPVVFDIVSKEKIEEMRKNNFNEVEQLAFDIYNNMRKEYNNYLKKKDDLIQNKIDQLYGFKVKR